MSRSVLIELEMPGDLKQFRLPKGVDRRLQELLDKQSCAGKLSRAERQEAEGLVNLAEMLSLLQKTRWGEAPRRIVCSCYAFRANTAEPGASF